MAFQISAPPWKRVRPPKEAGHGDRIPAFDGIRALAVLATFGAHTVGQTLKGSWIGVEVFFALSAFLITTLLLRERRKTGAIDLKAFFIRRVLRLAPAFMTMVVIVTPLALLAGLPGTLPAAVAALTYTADFYLPFAAGEGGKVFGHAWTLAVEEQFYLAWPILLVVGLGLRWPLVRVAAVLAVLGGVAGAVVAIGIGPVAACLSPFPHLPTLLLGAMLAFAFDSGRSWVARLRTPLVPVIVSLVGLGILFTAATSQVWLYWGGIAGMGALLVLLVGHLYAAPDGWFARALGLRPLVWLGERSYAFYLWHLPVLYLLPTMSLAKVPAMMIALAVTLLLTVISWHGVEKPFLRLKRRFGRVEGLGSPPPDSPTATS